MPEPIRSVMLAGRGLLRWPGGEERVNYRVTVQLDNTVGTVWIASPGAEVLHRPSRHGNIYLHMPEGRRLPINIAPNGYLSPDGPIERSLDGQDWWIDTTAWLPFENPDRFTLVMRSGPVQIFESHQNPEDAEASYRKWQDIEIAEIRPPFGRPTRLK